MSFDRRPGADRAAVFPGLLTEPVAGLKPYSALRLEGRDIYVREGCYACHSQMIRPFRAETERYGHYSVAGEFVYDRPFQWGSKRTGPDLHRVGGRYSDDWHRVHMVNPRDVVPESIMPGYPWLAENELDGSDIQVKMETLRTLGAPYTDAEIEAAPQALEGKTETGCPDCLPAGSRHRTEDEEIVDDLYPDSVALVHRDADDLPRNRALGFQQQAQDRV